MRIIIEKRVNKDADKQHIRFVYYYGKNADGKQVRRTKTLDQYLYNHPKTEFELQHNLETLQLVEQLKLKQIADYTKGQHGLIDAPVVFPEPVTAKLIKLTLTLDLSQLTKQLAQSGYQLVEANR